MSKPPYAELGHYWFISAYCNANDDDDDNDNGDDDNDDGDKDDQCTGWGGYLIVSSSRHQRMYHTFNN